MHSVTGSQTQSRPVFDGSYEILATVGRGRNSIVYKARRLHEPSLGQIVALKVLTGNAKDPELNIRRMKHEALAMLSCRHKNVIRLQDYVTSGDLCYLCMEYAERGDLRMLLASQSDPFFSGLVLDWTVQVLTGLETIHGAGIIHRDVKPENILLTDDGLVKIADFGIAVLPSEEFKAEEANRGVGTFDFLAPETLEDGFSNVTTDLYSVGVTMFQLLTRNAPFKGVTFTEQITNKLAGNRTPLSAFIEISPVIDKILDRALATDPDQRFQSAREFREAIEKFIMGELDPEFSHSRNGNGHHVAQELATGDEFVPFDDEGLDTSSIQDMSAREKLAGFLARVSKRNPLRRSEIFNTAPAGETGIPFENEETAITPGLRVDELSPEQFEQDEEFDRFDFPEETGFLARIFARARALDFEALISPIVNFQGRSRIPTLYWKIASVGVVFVAILTAFILRAGESSAPILTGMEAPQNKPSEGDSARRIKSDVEIEPIVEDAPAVNGELSDSPEISSENSAMTSSGSTRVEESKVELSPALREKIKALLQKSPRIGQIFGLLPNGEDVSLVIKGIRGTDNLIAAIGLADSTPQLFDQRQLLENGSLRMETNGLTILLKLSPSATGDGVILGGTYQELSLKRSGKWVLR